MRYNNLKLKNEWGFGLLELLISISIVGILSLIGIWYFTRATGAEALKKDTQGVVAIINEARALSLASKNALKYGVHLEEFQTVLFEGDTYLAGAATNKYQSFNQRVHKLSHSLNGGGDEIIFSRLTGETEDFGTITLSLIDDVMSSTTVSINESGVVQ